MTITVQTDALATYKCDVCNKRFISTVLPLICPFCNREQRDYLCQCDGTIIDLYHDETAEYLAAALANLASFDPASHTQIIGRTRMILTQGVLPYPIKADARPIALNLLTGIASRLQQG